MSTIPSLDDLQPSRRGLPVGIVRDLLALLFVVLGCAGVVIVAAIQSPLLGALAGSLLLIVIGVALGTGR